MKNSTNSSVALQINTNSAQQFSVSAFSQSVLEKLSDKDLYQKCQHYGEMARMWRQKFIGLLPEVNRRRLYEKKGFSSIFEFAFKLCGLSAEQVRLALNLEKRFEDKPILKKMLENGEVSINKLERIAFIATAENEKELAEKVKVLPTSALKTFVKDVRQNAGGNQDGLPKPLFEDKFTDVRELEFEIASDVKQQLNELNSKGIDVNELLREMLKKRQEKIAEKKEEIAKIAQPTASRHIPTETKKILHEEHGKKCSISTCQKPAKIIHHTQRFSLSQNHDPMPSLSEAKQLMRPKGRNLRFLAPLCREHHVIAHSLDFKFQKMRK